MTHLLTKTVFLAELTATTGLTFRNVALSIIGTLALVVLAARSLAAYANESYGKLVTLMGAGALVVGICYFPDQMLGILKGLFTAIFGS
jgi:hypothetical protein